MTTLSLQAPVVAVTVYPGQARVTRRGQVALPSDEPCEVLLGDLPLSLIHESVRVSGRGGGAISGIDVRVAHHAVDNSSRNKALLDERQRLAVEAQHVADQRRALDLRAGMFESVAEAAARPYARQFASGMAPAELGPVAENLAAQLAEVLASRRTLLDEEKRISDEQARVDRELNSPLTPTPDRTEVAVAVQPGAHDEIELEVSYLVEGASWDPRYDLRLDDESKQVSVTWFGMVRQHSGEDWPECQVRLSTARPTAAIAIPDLDPWFLTDATPQYSGGPRLAYGAAFDEAAPRAMAAPMPAAAGGPARARAEMAEPVRHVEAEVEAGVTAATYVIQHPVAVPSDGSDHQALISEFRLPAEVDHVTAPVRSDDVFLRATVTNSSGHTLGAGKASLFHGTEFVGVTDLESLAPNEKVELALGLDDRIRVKRELTGRHADKAILGSAARHEGRWRTTVGNYSGAPIRITVIDQAPVSQVPGITVRDVRTTPSATVDDLGEVTWKLTLADGEQADLDLAVRIEVARGTVLGGWRE